MRPSRAFNIAACILPLRLGVLGLGALGLGVLATGAALAQWPAPQQQQQQAPAGAWPAPQQQAPAAAAPAAAPPAGAWPAPQGGQAPQASQAPAQSFVPPAGFGSAMGAPQQQQEPPCFKDFMALRTEADKRGRAIQEASKKKVPPQVACRLFNDFTAAESKMIKYVSTNGDKCGMPKDLLENLNKGHSKTTEIRTRVCEVAAAGPPKPAGPTLSDVLSAPVPDSSNTRKGRGTFDTLSGSPLQR